jgi:pantoate ligase / CMP/dCMP kinase
MSSRNRRLSAGERRAAPALQRALQRARAAFQGGERRAAALLDQVRAELEGSPPLRLQYVEVVDPSSLAPVDPVGRGAVLALAAFAGTTRLIDNLTLE